MRSLKMLILALGLGTASFAQAFTVRPLTHTEQKTARQEIKQQLGAGTKVQSVKFGFGKTPPGFIGSGFEHATVKYKQAGQVKTKDFTVSPGMYKGQVNVFTPGR
jgi:hypothetical protein